MNKKHDKNRERSQGPNQESDNEVASDHFLEKVVAKAVDQIMVQLQKSGPQNAPARHILGGWNQI